MILVEVVMGGGIDDLREDSWLPQRVLAACGHCFILEEFQVLTE